MGNEEIINILTNFEGDFIIGNIMTYCLRMFGWLIIQGLSKLSDAMELITHTMYSLNNFFDSEGVKEIINLFKPVLFVILGLSIVYIGYKLITDREFKGSKVINNITLSVMVIMLLPTLMIKLNEATQYGISAIKSKGGIEVSTSAEQLIKSNLTDLYYLDSKNFKIDNNDNKNNSGSSGLGLAICKEIIKANSGDIWVDSIIGVGSTFYFTLKLGGVIYEKDINS